MDLNGQVVVVKRYFEYVDRDTRITREFKVFIPDLVNTGWIRKQTLGDFAIFLGDNGAVSVMASNFRGCEPNCIYFNHDFDHIRMDFSRRGPEDYGVYNLVNKSISQPYTSDAKTLLKMTKVYPMWIVPSLQL